MALFLLAAQCLGLNLSSFHWNRRGDYTQPVNFVSSGQQGGGTEEGSGEDSDYGEKVSRMVHSRNQNTWGQGINDQTVGYSLDRGLD